MTRLSVSQLLGLNCHIHIPDEYIYLYQFTEECILHYLVFNRIGKTKLRLTRNYFGGDLRRLTYSIRMMTENLYKTFIIKLVITLFGCGYHTYMISH